MNPLAPVTGLRSRLTLLVATLSMAAAMVLGWLVERVASREIEAHVGASLGELAFHMKERLDQGMFERWLDVQKLADMRIMRDRATPIAEQRRALEFLQSSYPDYAWIGLTDPHCRVVVATRGLLEGADVAARPWCASARTGPYAGDVHEALLLQKLLQGEGGEPLRFVDVATPVVDQDGMLIGVLGAHLSWAWADEVRASFMQPLAGRHGVEVFIVDRAGTVLLGDDDNLGAVLPLESLRRARLGKAGFVNERWPDGQSYLTGFAPATGYRSYRGLGWIVLVRKPTDEAHQPAHDLARFTLWVGSALTLLFIAIGFALASRLSRPLGEIAAAARRMREGRRDEVIPVADDYAEVAELSRSLRALVTSLRDSEEDARELNSSLERKVQDRTDALSALNTSLQAEISARVAADAERERLIVELEQLATRDALTGLLSRRAFLEQLDQALSVVSRSGNSLALVMMDIDHFKQINDSGGHAAGDAVLREVGRVLTLFVRASDSAARVGGEEFAILLRDADAALARQQAERLRATLVGTEVRYEGQRIAVTASFGVATVPPHRASRDALLKCADIALYRAKRGGRNRVEVDADRGSMAERQGHPAP